MKVKVSDYISDFFVNNGIRTVFTVVGGGAMHLNHSFGHNNNIKCIYNHHEQASSIAAEAYYRVNNEMAGLCVTSGPGAINALNGVVGAYQDSIPMIVVSGQTKTTLTTASSGLKLRTFGNQEFDIVSALSNVCKYSEMIMDPMRIRYCLEKAFFMAKNGRPGPCWLDIPIDVQGAVIESDDLKGYEDDLKIFGLDSEDIIDKKLRKMISKLKSAQRPILYVGNGIRIADGDDILIKIAHSFGIPVVTCWDSIDLIQTDDNYYVGRAGIMGDRAGNFAVQNSDFLICIGNRLNLYQIGFQYESWAREAYKVMVDIDPLELKKPTLNIDLPICCDAKIFMEKMYAFVDECKYSSIWGLWVDKCNVWKCNYPVVTEKQRKQSNPINIYGFIDFFSRKLSENVITVVANGSASVVGSAAYVIKKNQRFIMNCALSSMGYDLPAAIGAAVAVERNGSKYDRNIFCIAGDGSIQMNIQELQTIVTNNLQIKIVIINNEGYHQIRLTQTNLFNKEFVGIGPESNDLSFPNFGKLAYAYDIPYYRCDKRENLDSVLKEFLECEQYAMLEVYCDTKQAFEPKSATKRLENGTLYSPPLEDLFPFLPREELKENMIINILEE